MISLDPLKIGYYLVLPNDPLSETSPFQGFSPGWLGLTPFLEGLVHLPADIAEGTAPIDALISQRMGGGRMLSWTPINIDGLEHETSQELGLFVVMFSADEAVAARVEAWRARQAIKPLHITFAKAEGAMQARDFTEDQLIAHLRSTLAEHGDRLDNDRRELASRSLAAWAPRDPEPSGLRGDGHNVLSPNYMSLMRANRSFEDGERFMGRTETDYDEKILETVRAVFAARDRAGVHDVHRMLLIYPELWLVEPALYRDAYRRIDRRRAPDQAVVDVFQMI